MGAYDFFTNINLHLNALQEVTIEAFDTKPAPATTGRVVYNANTLWVDTGSEWVQLSGSAAIEALKGRVDIIEGYSAAYTSGITAAGVTQITTNANDITTLEGQMSTAQSDITGLTTRMGTAETNITALQSGKVNKLATAPTGTSGLKVTIDGQGLVTSVATAATTDLSDWTTVRAGIQDKLVAGTNYDTAPTSGSAYPVSSGGVFTAIQNAVTGAYKVKGSATCAELSSSAGRTVGDVYNVSDTGTITVPGKTPLSVNAGDNVVWTEDGEWDRLAGTMDLSGYVPKTTKINNHALSADITLTPADIGALAADGTAVKATADADGNVITTTYATQTTVAGKMNKLGAVPSAAGMIMTSTTADDAIIASGVSLTDVSTAIASEATIGSIKKWVADGYVAKESGKGLSTNDYTTAEKDKLAGIAAGAQVNVIESVKVNGSALTPDADKAVDITVPTDNAQLDNGRGYQNSSQVSTAIQNATYSKTEAHNFFGSAPLTFDSNGQATVSVSNIWLAQIVDGSGKIVQADVTIGSSTVTVDVNNVPQDTSLSLRYVIQPATGN